ncbi:MAG TPA: hypothetical protein V6C65_39515 [Allocoleopsis sp.]
MMNKSSFVMPQSRYRGQVKPENLVFDANLQEFSQRVSLISGLQTNGKLTAQEAFEQIESLWQQLETSMYQLGVGQNPFQSQP